jgi:hypothetical protein
MDSCSLGLSDLSIAFFQHFWERNELVMVVLTAKGLLAVRCTHVTSVSIPRRNPWGRSEYIYECEVRDGDDGNSALWIHLQSGDEALIEMEGPLSKTFRSDIIAARDSFAPLITINDHGKFLQLAVQHLMDFEQSRAPPAKKP